MTCIHRKNIIEYFVGDTQTVSVSLESCSADDTLTGNTGVLMIENADRQNITTKTATIDENNTFLITLTESDNIAEGNYQYFVRIEELDYTVGTGLFMAKYGGQQ